MLDIPKFKKGDLVRIKDSVEVGQEYSTYIFTREDEVMLKNKVLMVREVCPGDDFGGAPFNYEFEGIEWVYYAGEDALELVWNNQGVPTL